MYNLGLNRMFIIYVKKKNKWEGKNVKNVNMWKIKICEKKRVYIRKIYETEKYVWNKNMWKIKICGKEKCMKKKNMWAFSQLTTSRKICVKEKYVNKKNMWKRYIFEKEKCMKKKNMWKIKIYEK